MGFSMGVFDVMALFLFGTDVLNLKFMYFACFYPFLLITITKERAIKAEKINKFNTIIVVILIS